MSSEGLNLKHQEREWQENPRKAIFYLTTFPQCWTQDLPRRTHQPVYSFSSKVYLSVTRRLLVENLYTETYNTSSSIAHVSDFRLIQIQRQNLYVLEPLDWYLPIGDCGARVYGHFAHFLTFWKPGHNTSYYRYRTMNDDVEGMRR